MSGVRFFRRLEEGISHTHASAFEQRAVVDSVYEHLIKMLNTRQGSVASKYDYGLPDFNDVAKRFPDSIQELKREIMRCIDKYEPRLTNVEIHYVSDVRQPLDMTYEIRADVMLGKGKSNILFETTMHTSGNVEVRGW